MIYTAYELLAKLRCLVLTGVEDGELAWVGRTSDWDKLKNEEESILRDYEINKKF